MILDILGDLVLVIIAGIILFGVVTIALLILSLVMLGIVGFIGLGAAILLPVGPPG